MTNKKWYMTYEIVAIPMTLSDIQGHAYIASLLNGIFRTIM